VDEVGPRHGPALCDSGERHGTARRQVEVVCGAQSKVGEEFEIADAVGADLQVGGWGAVGRFSLQRFEVGQLDGAWQA